jgi:hypothetical protein
MPLIIRGLVRIMGWNLASNLGGGSKGFLAVYRHPGVSTCDERDHPHPPPLPSQTHRHILVPIHCRVLAHHCSLSPSPSSFDERYVYGPPFGPPHSMWRVTLYPSDFDGMPLEAAVCCIGGSPFWVGERHAGGIQINRLLVSDVKSWPGALTALIVIPFLAFVVTLN